ncbi:MAG: hypothetical protein ACI9QC_000451 [Oceanicoccus sp.]|jgi:hypothetical protein
MQKTCTITGQPFIITEEDKAFYEKMEVPKPTLCPSERLRRRLSHRNERFLYHRKCDLTGKQIISSASPEKTYPIYDIEAWWSDKWNPLDYGRDFDFTRSLFEQMKELMNAVPRMALQQQLPMENSEYCNCAASNKNCYLVFSANYCEDCYYGSWINYSNDCVDNENSMKNTLCYETIDCEGCYNVIYGEESLNCSDSAFIKNCISVKNSLFCTNMKHVEYHIFNQPVSKEEFIAYKKKLNLGSWSHFQAAVKSFEEFKAKSFVKFMYGTSNEKVTGNYNSNDRNCSDIYESIDCEDVRYANNLKVQVKDCMDYSYWGNNASLIYECHACGHDVYNLRFSSLCWSGCSNLTYCNHVFSSQDCFGSVGLKKAKFCILNKQYTEEEYNELVPKIIDHMKKTGEWGEFFPTALSPFAYNETLAQEHLVLSKEEALARGYEWQDPDGNNNYQGPQLSLADHISNVEDDITSKIFTCEATGDLYKIIPQELKFLRKMNLPLPRRSPDQRHFDRLKRRNPRQLWERNCTDCKLEIQTTYAPERPETVLCEKCYLAKIN